MKTSTDRILTTHVGSLPRPQDVVDMIFAEDRNEPVDPAQFESIIQRSVVDALRYQKECSVDIPSDGEQSKISYATYIKHRLTGFEGDSERPTPQDLDDYPDYRDKLVREGHSATYQRPVCKSAITVKDLGPVRKDIARMKKAMEANGIDEGFINAASPGTVSVFQPNEFYPSHEAYMEAVANGMKAEYEEITKAGLIVQLDCPDLAMGRHSRFKDLSEKEFLKNAEIQVAALNHALENVPADQVRMHVCWGNYEGPHTHDIELEKILPIVLKAKPKAFLLEGANPRHGADWEIWKTTKLPDDKVLVPGVVETTTNFVEHPRLVAQRIERYANVIGKERVIAGSDCGFGTFAGFGPVVPSLCWMKLKSMAEGARIASDKLWGRA